MFNSLLPLSSSLHFLHVQSSQPPTYICFWRLGEHQDRASMEMATSTVIMSNHPQRDCRYIII